MNIFLTGASGFVGRHVLRTLVADGHQVLCHVRSTQVIASLKTTGAQIWQGNLQDQDSLSQALMKIDSIIHCAAETGLWCSRDVLMTSNVSITRSIIQAAKRSQVKQFIYMSDASIAKDPSTATVNLTEASSLPNLSAFPYLFSKSQAEVAVLQSGIDTLKTICLRPAWVWGKGDIVDQSLGKAANVNKFGWFSRGSYVFSTCYIDNLCDAVKKTLLSNLNQEAFFISDGPAMNFRKWMSMRLKVGGFSVPTLSIPRAIAWPLAKFTENGWKYLPLKGTPPLTREMVCIMAYPFSVSIQKAETLLGYQPLFSIEAGMLEVEKLNS